MERMKTFLTTVGLYIIVVLIIYYISDFLRVQFNIPYTKTEGFLLGAFVYKFCYDIVKKWKS